MTYESRGVDVPKEKDPVRVLTGRIAVATRWGNTEEEIRARREYALMKAEKLRREAEAIVASLEDES